MNEKDYRFSPVASKVIDQLRERIGFGEFKHRLPSTIALSRQFGVSRPTLMNAIKALKAEGIIRTRQGSGTYLASSTEPMHRTRESTRYTPEGNVDPQFLSDNISLSGEEILGGVEFYLFTKARLAQIANRDNPNAQNERNASQAVARYLIATFLKTALGEPTVLVQGLSTDVVSKGLKLGVCEVFNQEVSAIFRAGSVIEAALELAPTKLE